MLNLRHIENFLAVEDVPRNTQWYNYATTMASHCVPRLDGKWATGNLNDIQIMQLWTYWRASNGLREAEWLDCLKEDKETGFRSFKEWLWSKFKV